jgi:hypothetical protein
MRIQQNTANHSDGKVQYSWTVQIESAAELLDLVHDLTGSSDTGLFMQETLESFLQNGGVGPTVVVREPDEDSLTGYRRTERDDLIGRTVVVTADTPEYAKQADVQSPQFGQHGEFPGRYLIRFSDGKHRMYYASEFTVVPRAGSFRRQQQDG